ncbi:MAG: 50S ribosomal protein L25 [Endomicrobiales bacterium]|nr:50S ribosomal protein L25 [Endomicrobiales bacterium]
MKEVQLEVNLRNSATKHGLKNLRSSGAIPAIFYGHGERPTALSVNAKKFGEIIHASGANVLLSLRFGKEAKTAIVKEVQRDVITQKPIHIDFQAISLKEKVEVLVPVHIAGTAPGVKVSGGIMEHIVRELKVSCLPTDIPDFFEVDVSGLEINHSITVKDLPKREGIEVLTSKDSIIVNIVSPTVLEEAPAPGTEEEAAAIAAAAGPAEPEVISKGKKDKEEGEAGAAAAAPGKAGEPAKAPAKAPEKK